MSRERKLKLNPIKPGETHALMDKTITFRLRDYIYRVEKVHTNGAVTVRCTGSVEDEKD